MSGIGVGVVAGVVFLGEDEVENGREGA